MGGGSWSTNSYDAKNLAKSRAGYASSFTHTEDISKGKTPVGAHNSLDPKYKNKKGPFADKITREAADSDEHPNSTPIVVMFDVTGSMGGIPMVLQQKLPNLHGLLQRKGYVEDPQIMFGAIGDAYSDRVPLQVSQFESDNTMDDHLGNIYIERGGGGGNHESYNLAAYFVANHTHIDSYEKRGQKGYLFLIGDERIYKQTTVQEIDKYIGEKSGLQGPVDTKDVIAKLQEKWNVFFLFAKQGSYTEGAVLDNDGSGWSSGVDNVYGWRELLGEQALILEDADEVCEAIGLTLGMMEGGLSYEDGLTDITDAGGSTKSLGKVGQSLATVSGNATSVVSASENLPDVADDGSGISRL